MKRWVAVLCSLVAVMIAASCDDEGDHLGPCDDLNWRAETPDQIACPYAPDCLCPDTGVCCVDVNDYEITGAHCSQLADCSGLAFRCDGPEDCGSVEVCCAVEALGGGSSCVDEMDCNGIDEYVMCRGDEDCGPSEHCYPAGDGGYFEGIAGYCDL